jgi:Protein of unknown function (DUF3696)
MISLDQCASGTCCFHNIQVAGVRFRPLSVDQTGEFRDRWPNGFFDERGEELF